MAAGCAIRLQRALDRAMAWRRRELILAYLAVPSDDASARMYCRQAVLLLYAHVEGFVKFAATSYLSAISESGVQTATLCHELLGLALPSEVNRAIADSSMAIIGKVVERAINNPATLPELPSKGIVRTHANLSPKRLRKILATIGLDQTRYSAIEIDVLNRLLKWRNAIAHGQGVPIDRDDYRALHHRIVDFMDDFKNYLEDSAAGDAYLL